MLPQSPRNRRDDWEDARSRAAMSERTVMSRIGRDCAYARADDCTIARINSTFDIFRPLPGNESNSVGNGTITARKGHLAADVKADEGRIVYVDLHDTVACEPGAKFNGRYQRSQEDGDGGQSSCQAVLSGTVQFTSFLSTFAHVCSIGSTKSVNLKILWEPRRPAAIYADDSHTHRLRARVTLYMQTY